MSIEENYERIEFDLALEQLRPRCRNCLIARGMLFATCVVRPSAAGVQEAIRIVNQKCTGYDDELDDAPMAKVIFLPDSAPYGPVLTDMGDAQDHCAIILDPPEGT